LAFKSFPKLVSAEQHFKITYGLYESQLSFASTAFPLEIFFN